MGSCTRILIININNDRMAGGETTTLRNIPVPKGIALWLPGVYPIFPNFIPGERLQLCAESPTNCHTLRVWESSMRLIFLINLGLEPRAPSPGH